MKKLINKFSTFELVLIALMAALGIAVKPIIVPLVHIITGPLYIPGGAAAGGIYMLFLVMAGALTGKPGAITLAGAIQTILIMATGVFGTHGAMSIITYMLPAIGADLVVLIFKNNRTGLITCFFAGIAANTTGTFAVNLVFFRMPAVMLVLTISIAALSGGIGGVIAYKVTSELRKSGVISGK